MLFVLGLICLVLGFPMGPKAGAKRRADFNVKELLAGNYTLESSQNFEEPGHRFRLGLTISRGEDGAPDVSSGVLEEVRTTITKGEDETEKETVDVVKSQNISIKVINATSMSIDVHGKHWLDLSFVTDEKTGSVSARGKDKTGAPFMATIVNSHAYTIHRIVRGTVQTLTIHKQAQPYKPSVWQKMMSPMMMIISMLVSQYMRRQQMQALPQGQGQGQQQEGVDHPVDLPQPEPRSQRTRRGGSHNAQEQEEGQEQTQENGEEAAQQEVD
ncbi:hypothetical protein GMRT_10166 [Giardia muris]|uniref:Uncharacterized protein n=1 Tax=Giardia muris TaxID=5742 RepID=A0A4Z1SPG6_GIAMU|nr:hypothetical protein GMRT_10166 [Giardia muris]|eukprot:TNJ26765.1 hypothetical protein GMRT_10166 [Giardia muris]